MIQYLKKKKGQALQELDQLEIGCWINVYPPYTRQELEGLRKRLSIPVDYVDDSLDFDERPRYEQEDGVQLIIINIPIQNIAITEDDALYSTIPIGIIEVDDYVLTISKYKNSVIDYFLNDNSSQMDTTVHNHFVLLLFDRTVYYYLFFLKKLNYQRYIYEKEVYNSSRNKELSQMLNIQKSLVYFVTTLRSNEIVMLKIQRTDFLKIRDNEACVDFMDDILVDTGQALEMANIYTNILNGTMDAFAAIISNNLNIVMRRLTSVTIVLMVPTLVASFYGMNVTLPFDKHPQAYVWTIAISIIGSIMLVGLFKKQNWL